MARAELVHDGPPAALRIGEAVQHDDGATSATLRPIELDAADASAKRRGRSSCRGSAGKLVPVTTIRIQLCLQGVPRCAVLQFSLTQLPCHVTYEASRQVPP